jgi:hypothetical protein
MAMVVDLCGFRETNRFSHVCMKRTIAQRLRKLTARRADITRTGGKQVHRSEAVEMTKLREYASVVERALQAAEICEACATPEEEEERERGGGGGGKEGGDASEQEGGRAASSIRTSRLLDAGLVELYRSEPISISMPRRRSYHNVRLAVSMLRPISNSDSNCSQSLHDSLPPRFARDEIIVCLTELPPEPSSGGISDDVCGLLTFLGDTEDKAPFAPSSNRNRRSTTIATTSRSGGDRRLRLVAETSLVHEEVGVHGGVLDLALAVLSDIAPRLALTNTSDPSYSSTSKSNNSSSSNRRCGGSSRYAVGASATSTDGESVSASGTCTNYTVAPIDASMERALDLNARFCHNATATPPAVGVHVGHPGSMPPSSPLPFVWTASRVRLVGFSLGGSVSALCAVLLDGTVRLEEEEEVAFDDRDDDQFDNDGVGRPPANSAPLVPSSLPYAHLLGAFRGRVAGYCLGPAPCLSRSVIPRFVASVAYGDDAVPRATRGSLLGLRARISDALRDVRWRSRRLFDRPALLPGRTRALAALRGVAATISDTVQLGGTSSVLVIVILLAYRVKS